MIVLARGGPPNIITIIWLYCYEGYEYVFGLYNMPERDLTDPIALYAVTLYALGKPSLGWSVGPPNEAGAPPWSDGEVRE